MSLRSTTSYDAYLYFEKGHLYEGQGFGAKRSRGGEAVFNTGMSGYQEIFTDPSYSHQVVVMTTVHLGNTGINSEDIESPRAYLSGVVAREYNGQPSSWRSQETLDQYLRRFDVPLISEVDTREITILLRDEGAQRSIIFPKDQVVGKQDAKEIGKSLLETVPEMEGLDLVSVVSCKTPYEFDEPSVKSSGKTNDSLGTAVVYDFGVKWNILRELRRIGFKVWVVPHDFPHQEALALNPKAIVLSNGPGDPATVPGSVQEIQKLIGKKPILAICMGHQLLARALGGTTYKLKFGHHGVNHPVKDLTSNKIMITSQNHGFAVAAESLKGEWIKISHLSLNDHTVEGFVSNELKLLSVQFHPEAKPGPSDANSIFDIFTRGFFQ